jgi:hypothetical protein
MSTLVPVSKRKLAGWFTPETIRVGLVGGIVYAIIALWVYTFVRQDSFWDPFFPSQFAGALLIVYVAVGLILLGGVSIALLYRSRLVSPLVVLISLFSWVSYRSWQSFEAARTAGVDPGVTLRPDAAFLFLWFLPLGVLFLFGAIEYVLRARLNGSSGTGSD